MAVRPSLWATAITQLFRLAAPGWWRRSPFLPLPSPDYLRFRLMTVYGGTGEGGTGEGDPEVADLIAYLEWCRAW